jgi:hypothetical protein
MSIEKGGPTPEEMGIKPDKLANTEGEDIDLFGEMRRLEQDMKALDTAEEVLGRAEDLFLWLRNRAAENLKELQYKIKNKKTDVDTEDTEKRAKVIEEKISRALKRRS